MRTTLDLSDSLLEEAMALTKIRTKTEVITRALENLIQKAKLQAVYKERSAYESSFPYNEKLKLPGQIFD